MAVTVKIPAQLRIVTDDEGEIEVDGATVGARARGGVRPRTFGSESPRTETCAGS